MDDEVGERKKKKGGEITAIAAAELMRSCLKQIYLKFGTTPIVS